MPQLSPETLPGGSAIDQSLAEIAAINREFLRLLTCPGALPVDTTLGLSTPVLTSLRSLASAELDELARCPLLLAEFDFDGLTADPGKVADGESATAGPLDTTWPGELTGFADRLLTCVWRAAHQDELLAAFCTGFDQDKRRVMAGLNFRRIRRYSRWATACLRARLAGHPVFWPGLIRSVRTGSREQKTASQLSIIQLSVAQRRAKMHNRRSCMPSQSIT